jgi:WD40 repeat protein
MGLPYYTYNLPRMVTLWAGPSVRALSEVVFVLLCGQFVASGSLDELVIVWNIDNARSRGQELQFAHKDGVTGVAFIEEDRLVSAGTPSPLCLILTVRVADCNLAVYTQVMTTVCVCGTCPVGKRRSKSARPLALYVWMDAALGCVGSLACTHVTCSPGSKLYPDLRCAYQ